MNAGTARDQKGEVSQPREYGAVKRGKLLKTTSEIILRPKDMDVDERRTSIASQGEPISCTIYHGTMLAQSG